MIHQTRTNPLVLSCPDRFRPREKILARLLEVVGLERFLELQDVLGGRRLTIPGRGKNWPCGICSVRDRCIRSWRKQGHSPSDIAGHLGISRATVRRVLGKRRHPPFLKRPVRRDAGPIEAV